MTRQRSCLASSALANPLACLTPFHLTLKPPRSTMLDTAAGILGYDLRAVCANGPRERLDATDISQPALFVAGACAAPPLIAAAFR
jgi:hypothetical protein